MSFVVPIRPSPLDLEIDRTIKEGFPAVKLMICDALSSNSELSTHLKNAKEELETLKERHNKLDALQTHYDELKQRIAQMQGINRRKMATSDEKRLRQRQIDGGTNERVRHSANEDEGYNLDEICDTKDHPITFIKSVLHHIEEKAQCDFLPALLKFHGTTLTTLVNVLFCYALVVQGVILVKAHTTYGHNLSRFTTELSCIFCRKKLYHLKRKNGAYYFSTSLNAPHKCEVHMLITKGSMFVSSLKNALGIEKKDPIDLSAVDAIVNKLEADPALINVLAMIHSPRFAIGSLYSGLLSLLVRRRRTGEGFDRILMDSVSVKRSAFEVVMDALSVEQNYKLILDKLGSSYIGIPSKPWIRHRMLLRRRAMNITSCKIRNVRST